MKRYNRVAVSLFAVVVLVWALACTGSEPVTMADIPVYPDATLIESGDDPIVDMLVAAMEEGMAESGEDVNVEFKTYGLGSGVSWDDIKSFYEDELAGTDWETDPELSEDSAELGMVGWLRGSGASEQGLLVAYVADIFGDGATLLIVLVSE